MTGKTGETGPLIKGLTNSGLPLVVVLCLVTLLGQPAIADQEEDQRAAWKQLSGALTVVDGKEADTFPVRAAQKFGSDVIVECNGFKLVDVDKLALRPLLIGNATKVDSIYDDDRRLYALCSVAHGAVLKVKDETGWHDMDVPIEVAARPEAWLVTAGDGDIALVSSFPNNRCYSLNKKKWEFVSIHDGTESLLAVDRKAVMRGGKVYRSFDLGEWGGQITAFNCETGKGQTIFKNDFHPVTDLKFASDGTLWFVTRMSGFGSRAGLFSYDGKIKCISEIAGISRALEARCKPLFRASVDKRNNWDLEPTLFEGLVIDTDGSLLTATPDYGIMKYSHNNWSRQTPAWKECEYLCGFRITESGVAVLPVYDRGVILYDMKRNVYKFILPKYSNSQH